MELNGGTSTEQHISVPPALSDDAAPASLEDSGRSVPGSESLNHSRDPAEVPGPSSPDPDSFCDSYTHITPSAEEPPASLLTTETLGGGDFTREEEEEEEERLAEEGAVHLTNGEKIQQEDESDLSPRKSDLGKQAGMNSNSDAIITLLFQWPHQVFVIVSILFYGEAYNLVCLYPLLSSLETEPYVLIYVWSVLGGPAGYGLVQYLGQEVVWRGCGWYEGGSMMWQSNSACAQQRGFMTPCRSKLASEGPGPPKSFLQCGAFGLWLCSTAVKIFFCSAVHSLFTSSSLVSTSSLQCFFIVAVLFNSSVGCK